MNKKQVIRVIAVFMIVCVMLILLCDMFEQENTNNMDKRFTTYRNLEEDTVDAVYIGTSGVDRYWIAAKAYEEYGMTVYPLATESMPAWLLTNVIDEAYTYQNPQLVIIDVRCLAKVTESAKDMDIYARRVIDSMSLFSVNRIKTAFKTMESIHTAFEEEPRYDLSYIFSFAKYHPRWSEDSFSISDNMGNREHEYLGFYVNKKRTATIVPQEPVIHNPNLVMDLDPLTEASLYELLDYAEEKNIELLFADSPQCRDITEAANCNRAMKILEAENQKTVNFYTTDENGAFAFDLSYETDFYNEGHVNYYGAEKYTAVFAQYLHENYDLPDRRDDEAVKKDWDGVYDKLKAKIAEYEESKREDAIQAIQDASVAVEEAEPYL